MFFFFNDTATTEIYTLSLHDALPIFMPRATAMMGVPTFYVRLLQHPGLARDATSGMRLFVSGSAPLLAETHREWRSEEHTSELQSRQYLVCRLLLEKTKKTTKT